MDAVKAFAKAHSLKASALEVDFEEAEGFPMERKTKRDSNDIIKSLTKKMAMLRQRIETITLQISKAVKEGKSKVANELRSLLTKKKMELKETQDELSKVRRFGTEYKKGVRVQSAEKKYSNVIDMKDILKSAPMLSKLTTDPRLNDLNLNPFNPGSPKDLKWAKAMADKLLKLPIFKSADKLSLGYSFDAIKNDFSSGTGSRKNVNKDSLQWILSYIKNVGHDLKRISASFNGGKWVKEDDVRIYYIKDEISKSIDYSYGALTKLSKMIDGLVANYEKAKKMNKAKPTNSNRV